MKSHLLILFAVICLADSLRNLGYYLKMEEAIFDGKKDVVLDDKQTVYYSLVGMDCVHPKYTRYLLRGSFNPNDKTDYVEMVKQELNNIYPDHKDQCTYRLIGGGQVNRAKNTITITGQSSRYGVLNAKLVSNILRRNNGYKGLFFVTE